MLAYSWRCVKHQWAHHVLKGQVVLLQTHQRGCRGIAGAAVMLRREVGESLQGGGSEIFSTIRITLVHMYTCPVMTKDRRVCRLDAVMSHLHHVYCESPVIVM